MASERSTTPSPHPRTSTSPPSPFADILGRVLELRWRSSPVAATADGAHHVDDQLDSFDPAVLERDLDESDRLIGALRGLPDHDLTPDEQLDRGAVLGMLTADLHEWREVRSFTFNPAIYPELATYSCYLLAVRGQPSEPRLRSLVARLRAIPRLLEQGLASLEKPAEVLLDNALRVCAGSEELFTSSLPLLAARASPDTGREIADSCATAWAAMQDYARAVHSLASLRGTRSPAIGEAAFAHRFRHAHGLERDPDGLISIAAEARRRIEQELGEVTGESLARGTWRERLTALEQDHPPADGLLDAYRNEIDRVRAFVIERHIATPTEDPLEVVATPPFERNYLPFAAYLQPTPLEDGGTGLFYVTPVELDASPDQAARTLERHSRLAIAMLVVHEAHPGHHLHFSRAKRRRMPVRLIYGTPLMSEGWALYCERMMVELGFVDDQAVRLFQLRDELWRAWRVEIDVRMHRGEWHPARAVKTLVDQIGFDEASARAEIARYCAWPTQASTYLIGAELLRDLRDRVAEREATAFDLGAFHDRLLDFGHLSPAAITASMLTPRLPVADPAMGAVVA